VRDGHDAGKDALESSAQVIGEHARARIYFDVCSLKQILVVGHIELFPRSRCIDEIVPDGIGIDVVIEIKVELI
jgi:hypothetical protein